MRHARPDRRPDSRSGRREQAQVDRRVRGAGELPDRGGEHRAHAQSVGMARAGTDAGVRRVHPRAERHAAGDPSDRSGRRAGWPGRDRASGRVGALLVSGSGRSRVRGRLPARVLARYRASRRLKPAPGLSRQAAPSTTGAPMRLLAALAVLVAAVSASAEDPSPGDVRLVAGATTIEAGKQVEGGVLLALRPGWHVYWLNPGDAGLPTSVRWTMPDGFTVGALRWPV